MLGCNYPFTDVATYVPWRYQNSSAEISFNLDVQLRSQDDPLVYLESITEGTDSFESIGHMLTVSGINLFILGSIMAFVAILFCVILYATQVSFSSTFLNCGRNSGESQSLLSCLRNRTSPASWKENPK
jgi:hypothetical protein